MGVRLRPIGVPLLLALLSSGCGGGSSGTPPSGTTTPSPASPLLGTTRLDVNYCTGGGVPLALDVYYPSTGGPRFPVVVYIHGGQLIMGNKAAIGGNPADMWRTALGPRGYVFVLINYRLGPTFKFPAMIEDAKCTIRYLRANAAGLSIDADRIGVTGTSSGGYLAALVAVTDASGGLPGVSSRVRAAVIEYGADMDLRQPAFSAAEATERLQAFPQPPPPSLIAAGTVVNHVTADDPPFSLFHGERDLATDPQDSIDLHNVLLSRGVPSSFQLVTNAAHGWENAVGGPINPSWPQILEMEITFFNTHLR